MLNSTDLFVALTFFALILFLVMLALRWVNCWYWKINHRLHALEDMNQAMENALKISRETNQALQDIRTVLLVQNGHIPLQGPVAASVPVPPAPFAQAPQSASEIPFVRPSAAPAEDEIPDL